MAKVQLGKDLDAGQAAEAIAAFLGALTGHIRDGASELPIVPLP